MTKKKDKKNADLLTLELPVMLPAGKKKGELLKPYQKTLIKEQ